MRATITAIVLTVCGIALLIAADQWGNHRRCAGLDPASFAYSYYCR